MAVHDNFVALAKRLIDANGRDVSIRRTVKVPDPVQPWNDSLAQETVQDYATKAVFLDHDSRDLLLALPGQADQQTIIRRDLDRQVLIPVSGLAIDIETQDVLIDGSTTWEIYQINLLQPGPTKIMWVLRVSR